MKRVLAAILFATAFVTASPAQTPHSATGKDFVIDENRPYVYLLFDHVGEGTRFADDEPSTRIWFRLINNCRVPIRVRTFGTPKGSPAGEVGLFHNVVEDVVSEMSGVTVTSGEPPATTREKLRMPSGYGGDVSSAAVILPKNFLLFSIPTTHLSEDWHIEIPYEFAVPRGKCCRAVTVGGEPKMVLLYSEWYLPENVRRELKSKQ